jgi:hypothetical protein
VVPRSQERDLGHPPAVDIVNMTYYDRIMSMRSDKSEPANQEIDCSVREATFGDYEAICQVKRRNGLGCEDYLDWVRLWNDNPFRLELSVPIGWVLESKTQGIVGTFSNIPRMYTFNCEPVRAAVASAWAVDPHFRSAAIFLINKYFTQKNVDLFLNTTASPQAGVLFKAFKCKEIPGPSFARILFWITNYTGLAGTLLRKARVPAFAGMRHAAGIALRCQDLAHLPKGRYQGKEICLLPSFDERFDAIWELLCRRRGRLLAVRTREALTWQFRPAPEYGAPVILGLLEGNSLSGYLIMKRYDQEQFGLRRFRVVDIQALRDEASTILSLMSAALEHAARCGVDVVEAIGFHESKRNFLERLNPRHRSLPSCPYLYRVSANSRLPLNALHEADAWDPSPFDGDAAL